MLANILKKNSRGRYLLLPKSGKYFLIKSSSYIIGHIVFNDKCLIFLGALDSVQSLKVSKSFLCDAICAMYFIVTNL